MFLTVENTQIVTKKAVLRENDFKFRSENSNLFDVLNFRHITPLMCCGLCCGIFSFIFGKVKPSRRLSA